MLRKRQNSLEDLLAHDYKFAPSRPCALCGKPTLSISLKCRRCLETLYVAEELAYAREQLRGRGEVLVELGHGPDRRLHLVLLRARELGWCGAQVTQLKSKREWVPQGKFPPGVCGQCLQVYMEF
jgi:hypothetical protein